ncbi:hypothetical protein ABS241_19275, partial [Acinetobacter baumannii]
MLAMASPQYPTLPFLTRYRPFSIESDTSPGLLLTHRARRYLLLLIRINTINRKYAQSPPAP